jgi:hypothetical protein
MVPLAAPILALYVVVNTWEIQCGFDAVPSSVPLLSGVAMETNVTRAVSS